MPAWLHAGAKSAPPSTYAPATGYNAVYSDPAPFRAMGRIPMADNAKDRVILEYIPVGKYVKVSAVDPRTKVEVSIVGDPKQGEEALKRTAVRKLHYVLRKRSQGV